MKRLLLLLVILVSFAVRAQCQSISVALSVTDSSAQSWNNGTYSITFNGPASAIWQGGALTLTQSGSLSATGTASITLADNKVISPGGTTWIFTVCPIAVIGGACFTSSQAAAASIALTPPAIVIPVPTTPQVVKPVSAYADSEISGGWVGFTYYNLATGTRACSVVTGNACTTWAAAGGITSPSSLTNYFNGYTGLSPKDCSTAACNTPGVGAKGDWHAFYDCTINSGTAIENCTGSHFTSTAVDGGKTAELFCNSAILVTTISTVQSGTQATLAATCSTTQTNTYFAFGTDDTAALRNWSAFISAAFSSTSTTPTVRGGYLPRGIYYTTKAVRFIWPGAVQPAGDHTTGECAKIAGVTIWCPLVLTGDGTWASQIAGASNFNWAADGAATNTGLCYFNNWSGSFISNMGCGWAAQQENNFSTNTTGQTGLVGTWVFDNNQHTKWDSNFASGGHCTGGPVCGGLVIDKDFESSYSNSALEFNDINLYINPSAASNTYEKIVFDTLFCEGGGGANGNIQLNQNAAFKQVTFRNVHSRDGTASVNIRSPVTVANGDALVFERFRQTTASGAANQGFVIQSPVKVECDNCYLEDTGGVAGAVLFSITASAELDLYGGGMFGSSMTNAINASGGTPTVYDYGARRTGITNLCTGTCTSVVALEPTATGWAGPGGITGVYFLSNQGTGCAIGNFALSAGWGTTAAPTAPAGFNQSCRITITASGTGQAANPTITWTLPTALPAATTTCEAHQSGGTGAFTMMLQTTLSATAPIFTLQGTPTAAATYIYDVRCGP